MSRKKGGRRALGPYLYQDRPHPWRIVTRGADGARGHREFDAEEEAVVYRDKYNSAAATSRTTILEALEKYEHHFLVVKGNKTSSWPETRRRILRLLGPSSLILSSIGQEKAASSYLGLTSEVSVDSHRGCLTNVKTFFSFCVNVGLSANNPFENVAGIGRKKRGKVKLTTDEARRFRDHAIGLMSRTFDRVLFERYLMGLTALYLGARSSEITDRLVRDIDEGGTVYRIPDSKTESGRRKGRIPPELVPFFRRITEGRDGSEALFPGRYHKTGKKHDHRYVTRYCVAPLCAALGLPKVTAHGLRGTFADLSVEEGMGSLAVAMNLGQVDDRVAKDHYISSQVLSRANTKKAQDRLRGGNVSTSVPSDSDSAANVIDDPY